MKFTILSHAGLCVEHNDVRIVSDPWHGSCYVAGDTRRPAPAAPGRPLCVRVRPVAMEYAYIGENRLRDAEPAYHANSKALFRFLLAIHRITPPMLRILLLIFLRKRANATRNPSGSTGPLRPRPEVQL